MSRRGAPAKRGPFNSKDYEKFGVSAEEVMEIKEAFDLFDY